MKCLAIVLAVVSLLSGIGSAIYWFLSSRVGPKPGRGLESGELMIQQQEWVVALLRAATESSRLNKSAALLSGACILAGSISNFIMVAIS